MLRIDAEPVVYLQSGSADFGGQSSPRPPRASAAATPKRTRSRTRSETIFRMAPSLILSLDTFSILKVEQAAHFEMKAEQKIILERPVKPRMHNVLNVRLHRQPIAQYRAIG
jgi:hypothetical protein